MDQLSFAEITHVLHRQWRMIVAIIFAAVAVAIIYTWFLAPQTWTATCSILFEPQLSGSALPAELAGLLPMSGGRSSDTYSTVLQSRSMRERVVKRLNLVEEFGLEDEPERAEEVLRDMYTVVTKRNVADLLTVNASAGSPPRHRSTQAERDHAARLAADIANTLVDELRLFLESADYMRANQRTDFLAGQAKQAEAEMLAAQDALVQYAVEHGLVNPGSQVGEAVRAASTLQGRVAELRMQVEGARKREQQALAQLSSQERLVVSAISEQRNPAIDDIQTRIRDLQREIAQLTEVEGKSERHPDVERARVALEAAQGQLKDALADEMRVSREDLGPSPGYNTALSAALSTQLERSGLEAQLASALAARQEAIGELQTLPSSAAQYTYLEGQLELRKSIYEQVAKQYEASRVGAASAMPKFTVLDAAIPPLRANGPSTRENTILALMAGLALGVILAFWREGQEARRRAQAEVESAAEA
ncbi:MAG: GumC family protein [Armatimonadota bacterium]